MSKFFKEFREFALHGNVINLAVGVIIGVAFQGVISSLTDNIISPIIGIFAKQNFDYLQLDVLGVSLKYGAFITSVINFLIMAFVVFLIVRTMNRVTAIGQKAPEPTKPDTKLCAYCLSEINAGATRCPACTSEL
ncbi:MAG: large conductance mechanosensitive channel protein MscL [Clostridiales bacterium]|nr:large conductance mechanosensitive channel protein MscL [Clostridiales bacterium]